MAENYTEQTNLQLDKSVEIDKESLDMNNLALSNVTKYLATYNNPHEWVLDEKEARVAQVLSDVRPEKSSKLGSLLYSGGELLRTTYAAPREFAGAIGAGVAALKDRFYPNAEKSSLERWADNYAKIEAQRERTSQELISQEVGHEDWYTVGAAAAGLARDIALTGGIAKLGATTAAKAATKRLAGRGIAKDVASRYVGIAAGQGAKKAGGAAISGSVFIQEVGSGMTDDINQYMEKTGDYDLKYYDPSVDLAVNVGVGALSAQIEKGLGVERFVPRLMASGKKIPGWTQILGRAAEGYVGEASEEGAQETLGQIGDMIKGYRDWWDFDSDKIWTSMTVGGALGGVAGGGLYYINRRTAINRLADQGLDRNTAADLVDTIASMEINKTINNLSASTELNNKSGQAYDKLKSGIKNALELQGWNEKMVDQKTGQPLNIDQYVDLTVNSQLINTAIKESFNSGISIDEFLDVAQFVGIDNFMVLKPLGTPEQIQTRIDEQNDIIKRQTELKKTGAGNDTLLREARIKKAILQKVKLNKIVDSEIQKVNVEESKTPEIKQEIKTATEDVDTLTKSETPADFNTELDNKTKDGQPLTTQEKTKRFGNAVIKKIFGSDKLGFDSVMTLPEYTNARTAITNSANKIFDFAKKHRTYGIYTDLRNALNLMRTVNQSNFIEHTKTPNLDSNDVIAENAFLYHFLFSDNNTISAFIDAYLERAEASITGETLNLSKKDLVGQAFKATDNLMQIQAESAGIEYNSIYNEDGSLKDENVASVFMSYQNQFVQEPTQLTLFQPEQFDIADENARLDDIYPEYTGETIEVDGKERTVYNSNGDRIAKSKEALTNFWRWFGDSKVVDSQGRPLVVYHGTSSKFDTFKIGEHGGTYGTGIYFGRKSTADRYGIYAMPVYLKISNPFIVEGNNYRELAPKANNVYQEHIRKTPEVEEDWLIYDDDIINWYLKDQGFDGIIDSKYIAQGANEFVVFDSKQAKSVDNRGTYSDKTGNIYYQGKKANGFYDPELDTVVLGKNWNTMTLPHEFAHYWLNTLFNLYKRVQSGELQANADWISEKRDMFAMLGIDENQQKLTTGQQEKFATMVESYLTGIGVSKEIPQTFKEYFQWVPEKYKSLQQLAYLDENGKVNNVFLDQKAVDFFNRWYENASLPSLSTSPERQRYMNVSDDNGVIQRVSIKEMNDRDKEFAQDAEEQYRTDQRLYNTLDENMPADIKPGADAQKVVINERSNFLKESQAEQQKITEEPKRRWFERKSRETETQLAQEYIDKNPEHAREVIFGDPELVPNDTGVDRATLINTYMAVNNITPDKPEWATLHTNIAINQSLAGTQLALSNDKSYGTYLDALREIENALELKAATNYAGSKVGAKEKFNSDIQRFLDKELPSIFATEPDSNEREVALKVMFEKARTTFSGNTTGSFLNQFDMDFAKKQTKKTDAFVRWATNQIKKDAGAKLNSDQQAHLLKISAKAQQSLEDLDSQDIPTAVAAGQDLRKWQLEKQKMMGVSPQKFSLFGDWAPRAMLASFNTLVVANVPSTAINTAVTNVLKTGLFGKNKVSDNLIKGEIKRIKAIYGATSMNLAQMEKPTSPSLLHGEKYSASGQKWYDPYTILGKEDNAFRVPTFVNTLAQIASKDAEATGRSADEVFKEYCALNNQSDSAKLARKQALAVSNMAVFTQNGALANCLNHIRSELNKLSRSIIGLDPQGFGLGNLIAPFLATGANIAEMGIRGSLAPVIQIATLVKQWRTGKKLDPIKALALRMDWTYFAISAVSMALLAALTSDDDEFYADPYRTGIKYDPNKPYDSINLGGYWLDLDFFGPFAIPMRTAAKIIQAWKKDNGLGEAILKGYAQSGKEVLGDIPLAESIVNNQVSWAMKKPGAWASSYIYTQVNKLVPAQIKSLSRVISRGQGWIAEPGGTVGRKFNRNYGFDGAELTSQDLLELFTIKLQLSNERQQQLDRLFLY